MDPSTGSTFLGTRSFLSIQPVRFEDQGIYECKATNEAGSDSVTFALIVNRKPDFAFQFVSLRSSVCF